jgi:MFS transporter, PAT family, beta-lactamase induction signal transducer AmpG
MTNGGAEPRAAAPEPRQSWREAFAVYLQRRVLIVGLLGFSGGVPIVLIGSTLQAWMSQSGVDIRTIGLYGAVAIAYNVKFFWSPVVDALDVPVLSHLLGRRRGWLMLAQIALIVTILLLALCDPSLSPLTIAAAALAVGISSATQDIVIDAFRVESLPEGEQAAGMASYVAAYRIGSLAAGAGALYVVAAFKDHDFSNQASWQACYFVMAGLILVGVLATLLAREPTRPPAVEAAHAAHARENPLTRAFHSAVESLRDFMTHNLAVAALIFVALFKLADAMAFALTTPFVLDLGFSLREVANIRNGIGFVASLLGGFAGGFIARAYPLSVSVWIGAVLQTVMILAFSVQALAGMNLTVLTITTTIEFFFDSVGTVILVAYLSALCRNPLYTATQYALLTAIAALGRNVFSLSSGYIVYASGWFWYFIICALLGVPALLMLAWLQRRGHFDSLHRPAGK